MSPLPPFLLSVFRLMVPVWDSVPTELSESLSTVAIGAMDKGLVRPIPFGNPVAARGSTALYGRSRGRFGDEGHTSVEVFLMALRGGGAGGKRRSLPFGPPVDGWISVTWSLNVT